MPAFALILQQGNANSLQVLESRVVEGGIARRVRRFAIRNADDHPPPGAGEEHTVSIDQTRYSRRSGALMFVHLLPRKWYFQLPLPNLRSASPEPKTVPAHRASG